VDLGVVVTELQEEVLHQEIVDQQVLLTQEAVVVALV
tara:strand:+ start:461 stop:571 length:111 start_codon:yes stop_codon:yes gene_type:complete